MNRLRKFILTNTASAVNPFLTDVGGWSNPAPISFDPEIDLMDVDQTGARLYLISRLHGDNETGSPLFWHEDDYYVDAEGSSTDEFGVAYGNDWENPKGKVYPYKNWGYCGPSIGNEAPGADNRQVGGITFQDGCYREGKPDRWMFRGGETIPLLTDLTEAGCNLGNSALNVGGGETLSGKQMICRYGPLSLGQVVFIEPPISGFIFNFNFNQGYARYSGMKLDGHDRTMEEISGSYSPRVQYFYSAPTKLEFEDFTMDGCSGFIWAAGEGGKLTWYGVVIVDEFSKFQANNSGYYMDQGLLPILEMRHVFFVRNGFREQDPANVAPGDLIHSVFDRAFYNGGALDHVNSIFEDIFFGYGGSADQMRCFGALKGVYVVAGGFALAANGGDNQEVSGSIDGMVLEKWYRGSAQPGYGVSVFFGAKNVLGKRLVITSAGLSESELTSTASRGSLGFGGMVPTWFHDQHNATEGCAFEDSYVYAPGADYALESSDGIDEANRNAVRDFTDNEDGTCTWVRPNTGLRVDGSDTGIPEVIDHFEYPAMTDNAFRRIKIIGVTNGATPRWTADVGAIGQSDPNTYEDIEPYADAEEFLADNPSAIDPTRTMKKRMLSLGYTVSSDDAGSELATVVKQFRRGRFWKELGGTEACKYVLEGFGADLTGL